MDIRLPHFFPCCSSTPPSFRMHNINVGWKQYRRPRRRLTYKWFNMTREFTEWMMAPLHVYTSILYRFIRIYINIYIFSSPYYHQEEDDDDKDIVLIVPHREKKKVGPCKLKLCVTFSKILRGLYLSLWLASSLCTHYLYYIGSSGGFQWYRCSSLLSLFYYFCIDPSFIFIFRSPLAAAPVLYTFVMCSRFAAYNCQCPVKLFNFLLIVLFIFVDMISHAFLST